MARPFTVLFQQGIPDIFFPLLEERGCRIFRFPTDSAGARQVFRGHGDAEAVFFRANFVFGRAEAELLPQLGVAALVSTGSDNIDATALAQRNIRLISGEGANAQAVFDYVIQALLYGGFSPAKHSVGVVGVGRVGARVVKFLQGVGANIRYYDPFLADPGSLPQVLDADFLTFHVPLTTDGNHATQGMLDEEYFKSAREKIRMIQTCRGGIWNAGFYRAADPKKLEILAQDVYPTEPPAAEDLLRARFSTPHIAGYSTEGRLGGILKGIRALFPDIAAQALWPMGKAWFLEQESRRFAAEPQRFSALRDNYGWRKEFHEYSADERDEFRRVFNEIPDAFFSRLFAFKG